MLTDEDRKYILHEFLRNIFHISDKSYQKRIWIEGRGPECDDFTETTCCFFEDAEGIIEEYKDFGINNRQLSLLIKLRNQYDKFLKRPESFYLPQDFIETPEWTKITVLAKEVLLAFGWPS